VASTHSCVPFCLVLACEPQQEFARNILTSLAKAGAVSARTGSLAAPDFRGDAPPDAIVLVATRAAPARVCDLVSWFRASAPSCSLLVVSTQRPLGDDADARVVQLDEACSADDVAARVHAEVAPAAARGRADVRELLNPRIRGLIGTNAAFVKEIAKLPTIAGCDAGVLILGETGTGKEIFARAVHYLSARGSKPWVPVNCGAIPAELVEDELFGHVRGAYTHAHTTRYGLIREAEGGTLFLDEIDALPFGAQVKLLRFLQEREYRPVGANALERANVRVIAASNNSLREIAMRGAFRQDLFFRLNALTMQLPPLRERRDDIPALALHFLKESAQQWNKVAQGFTAEALQRLLIYDWPGNVRELRHAIERAVLLGAGKSVGGNDLELGDASSPAAGGESFKRAKARVVEQFERAYIAHLLALHRGNIAHAAQAADKNRRAFWQLIRKHGIEPRQFR